MTFEKFFFMKLSWGDNIRSDKCGFNDLNLVQADYYSDVADGVVTASFWSTDLIYALFWLSASIADSTSFCSDSDMMTRMRLPNEPAAGSKMLLWDLMFSALPRMRSELGCDFESLYLTESNSDSIAMDTSDTCDVSTSSGCSASLLSGNPLSWVLVTIAPHLS